MKITTATILRMGFVLLLGSATLLATEVPAAGKKHKAGDSIRECRNCPELIVLPAGTSMD